MMGFSLVLFLQVCLLLIFLYVYKNSKKLEGEKEALKRKNRILESRLGKAYWVNGNLRVENSNLYMEIKELEDDVLRNHQRARYNLKLYHDLIGEVRKVWEVTTLSHCQKCGRRFRQTKNPYFQLHKMCPTHR